ncbi:MAG TPA: HAD family hydrolase [Thermoplasmatales archaeon]|nr:HAD family hydrolase [Thermoplasmatales archaeon]
MAYKLVVFDMDNTLLNGRTIFKIAEEKGFMDKLIEIIDSKEEAYRKTIEIAKLLRCMREKEFLKIFRKIPLNKNAEYVVKELKKMGMKIAIVTDSYQIAALDLKERLGIDYVFSNELVVEDGHITGEITLNNKMLTKKFEECKIHSICKKEVLQKLCKQLGIETKEVIAVGDSGVDICMLKEAGLGIAFNADYGVREAADVSISDLSEILKYAARV